MRREDVPPQHCSPGEDVIGCRTLSQDRTHVWASVRGVEGRADERVDMRLKRRVDLAAVIIEKEESSPFALEHVDLWFSYIPSPRYRSTIDALIRCSACLPPVSLPHSPLVQRESRCTLITDCSVSMLIGKLVFLGTMNQCQLRHPNNCHLLPSSNVIPYQSTDPSSASPNE